MFRLFNYFLLQLFAFRDIFLVHALDFCRKEKKEREKKREFNMVEIFRKKSQIIDLYLKKCELDKKIFANQFLITRH